jgi:TetR/AcrR family tetracycline transcriptional repressor
MNASRYGKSDVLAAAMRLLDEVGLPDLTMRKLAATLDVQPSALYWHYANKQSLLAEVSNTIVAFAKPVSKAAAWQDEAKLEALSLRDALLAFRDGAEVVSSTLALGLGANQALERLENAISIDKRDLAHAAAESILFLVLGQVWHEQQRMQANSLGVIDNLDLSETPNLEIGIQLILDGLSTKVNS